MRATEQDAMFLRPSEAGALTGLSTRAIYRAIERGELRAARLCSRLRISRESFDDWVARSVVPAGEHTLPEPPPVALQQVAGSFRALLAHSKERRR